ncbi:MAG TPA: phosphatase PAP2 family protein [Kofleriaceae bacterium]|nr:phosphatase PAP2 family protein [Kofleriaceae bacterium]
MIVRTPITALAALALGATAAPASADEAVAPLEPRLYFGALDELSHDDFSRSASRTSDILLAVGLATPVALDLARDESGHAVRLGTYAGGVLASGIVAGVMKEIWRRPRPYNFHKAPGVQAYARAAGKDARVSFPSGHTTLAFAAAAAGGWIYATDSDDTSARAAVWFTGTTIAGATAVLRMRAGKHYPSDVAMGAVIGIAGVAVPAIAFPDVDLSGTEIAAMAGGVLLGAGLASAIPFPRDSATTVDVAPLALRGGGGLAVTYSGW